MNQIKKNVAKMDRNELFTLVVACKLVFAMTVYSLEQLFGNFPD